MKNLLTSKWFALGVGMVGFLLTMFLLNPSPEPEPEVDTHEAEGATNDVPVHDEVEEHSPLREPPQPIVAPAPPQRLTAREVGDPGSLRFNNPEVSALVEELQREKDELRQWEAELRRLAEQIALEKESIGAITQEVLRAKAALEHTLTNEMTLTDSRETDQLKALAGVYTNMPPASAVMILDKMTVEDIAKIIRHMSPVEQAAILSNFATNSLTTNTFKATEISQKLRTLGNRPNIN